MSRTFPPPADRALSAEPIARQHFDTGMVALAMSLFFDGTFRFRATGRIFSILAATFLRCPVPCYTTVRLWTHRIGLHRLQTAEVGARWAMICDHTAPFGGHKLLVICGVDLEMLENRLQAKTGDFNLSHQDVRPLALVPMKNSSGEMLLEHYHECIRKHGNPEDMITDGGSDIMKSARLLAEYQQDRGQQPTRHIYDLSHRIARIIQAELEPSEGWQKLEGFITGARQYCKYRAKELSPPSLRHGPDRWMNLGGILKWYGKMVGKLESEAETAKRPRFGLTQRICEAGRATYRKCGRLFKKLHKLCGKEHESEKAYEDALAEHCPNMPEGMKGYLKERTDLNATYLKEIMEGWEEHRETHQEITKLTAFTNTIQKHLKKEGLSKETVLDCKKIYEGASLSGFGEEAAKKVMETLKGMAKDLPEGKRVLATSDVVESLNGKWKTLIEGSRTPALGSNALLMAALMGGDRADEIKLALETVKVRDVETWTRKTIGITFHKEKSAKPNPGLPENPQELTPAF